MLNGAIQRAIDEAFALLPARMESPEARVMIYAIGWQESRFEHRKQIGGPAKGFWQFERGGGVRGVMRHNSTKIHAMALCSARKVPWDEKEIYDALERDDVLAAGFARLLLFSHPRALPDVEAGHEEAWQYYIWCWRPGKPHRHTWDKFHVAAVTMVSA